MNPIRVITFASALSVSLTALSAGAEEADSLPRAGAVHPLQVSLWSTVQTSDQHAAVHGMRLNLPYGKNRELHGFDLGIANQVTKNMYGAELGLGGYVGGNMRGLQSHLVLSIVRGEALGMQQGIYTSADRLYGVQAGAVNHVRQSSRGARFAAVNLSDDSTEGAELGVVNYARRVRGVQVGLVNMTGELHGVQIGLANFAKNGFLPFFPVVNAAM